MTSRGRGRLLETLANLTSTDDSGHESKIPSDKQEKTTCLTQSSSSSEPVEEVLPSPPTRGRGRANLLFAALGTESGISGDQSSIVSDRDSLLSRGRGRLIGLRGRGLLLNQLRSLSDDVSSVALSVTEADVTTESPKESDIEPEICHYRGEKGVTSRVVVNYIYLKTEDDKGVFEYEVRFNPQVITKPLRYKLLNQMKEVIGQAKTFDGVTLYLPIKLDQTRTVGQAEDKEGNKYEVMIIFKKQKKLRECMHLYNVLFDRVMKILKYVRYNRKQFDPSHPIMLPQHHLEIWPGYVTAVNEYEGGLMLCLDVSFRVLNTRTVLDVLNEAYRTKKESYKSEFEKAILGSVVLTRYNNKTYRIDEVLWNVNPQSTFETTRGGQMSYLDYYKNNYGIEIRDKKQPLLLHVDTKRISGVTDQVEMRLCFVPELTYLTGLTDAMRSDFKIMKDVASHTRITPNQRANSLRIFLKSVSENEETRSLFQQWGLILEPDILRLEARTIGEEAIIFRNNKTAYAGPGADFNRDLCKNEVILAVDITNWLLVHTKRDSNIARKFTDLVSRNSRPMGIRIDAPTVVELQNDSVDAYVSALRKNLDKKHQIVVTLCPTARDDRYAAIKRICCCEIPIASQVINARTLNDDKKARGIVQKILLQMNAKMGGELWSIRIPLKNVMVIGIDSYHKVGGNSCAAFVASLNERYTRWYSRAVIQSKKEEVMNGLALALTLAIIEYKKHNQGMPPNRIIVFRDGVGDGQLGWVKDYEMPQLKAAFQNEGYNPDFAYIVCQKNINTRIMLEKVNGYENPLPGTVIDHSITRKELYDFFLVPQSVRIGTVTPTHFIVLEDTAKMTPDIMQRFTYKLCFMYYNWPGTVRVPAPCQYAHKMALLVGSFVKRDTHESLANKLFYL